MDYISSDLKVNEPTLTCIGNKFVSIENYLSIITYEKDIIKIKTKRNVVNIIGLNLSIKYIIEDEMGIVGDIQRIEYTN